MNALDTHYKHRLLHRERGFFCALRKDRKNRFAGEVST